VTKSPGTEEDQLLDLFQLAEQGVRIMDQINDGLQSMLTDMTSIAEYMESINPEKKITGDMITRSLRSRPRSDITIDTDTST
jgi:hypothetical protein